MRRDQRYVPDGYTRVTTHCYCTGWLLGFPCKHGCFTTESLRLFQREPENTYAGEDVPEYAQGTWTGAGACTSMNVATGARTLIIPTGELTEADTAALQGYCEQHALWCHMEHGVLIIEQATPRKYCRYGHEQTAEVAYLRSGHYHDCRLCRRGRRAKAYCLHSEEYRQCSRNYYAEHAAEYRQYQRNYHAEHAAEYRQYNRRYRREHAAELRQYGRNRYAERADDLRRYQRTYYAEHADELRQRARDRYRVRRAEAQEKGTR